MNRKHEQSGILSLNFRKKGDFSRYSSGKTFFFCQIYRIEMIQHLRRKKIEKLRKEAFFGRLLPEKTIILADYACFDLNPSVKYF